MATSLYHAPEIDMLALQPYRPIRAAKRFSDLSSLGGYFSQLPSISLEDTNRKAKMLTRIDNKYVVNKQQLAQLLDLAGEKYAILDIEGRNQFSYSSCYYDDDYACYFEHHQSRRQRFKVRTREYVDCGLRFYEIKLKGLRGKTSKKRIKCDKLITPTIEGDQLKMLQDAYYEKYQKPMTLELTPALIVGYTRCTLVAVDGGERVTIDYGLNFKLPNTSPGLVEIGNEFIIVETKSGDGSGTVDRALKQLGVRKAAKCSKYCLGLILTGAVQRKNVFLRVIRRIQKNLIQQYRPKVECHS